MPYYFRLRLEAARPPLPPPPPPPLSPPLLNLSFPPSCVVGPPSSPSGPHLASGSELGLGMG